MAETSNLASRTLLSHAALLRHVCGLSSREELVATGDCAVPRMRDAARDHGPGTRGGCNWPSLAPVHAVRIKLQDAHKISTEYC